MYYIPKFDLKKYLVLFLVTHQANLLAHHRQSHTYGIKTIAHLSLKFLLVMTTRLPAWSVFLTLSLSRSQVSATDLICITLPCICMLCVSWGFWKHWTVNWRYRAGEKNWKKKSCFELSICNKMASWPDICCRNVKCPQRTSSVLHYPILVRFMFRGGFENTEL